MKCIFKYLRRTKDLFLVYGGEELKLQGYTDSSFQSNPDDSRSTSRFLFTLNGGAVSWTSSKQPTAADSTTEAEYIVASGATKEVVCDAGPRDELGLTLRLLMGELVKGWPTVANGYDDG